MQDRDIIDLDFEIDYELLMHRYTIQKDILQFRDQIDPTVAIWVTEIYWFLIPFVLDFVTEHFVTVIFRKSYKLKDLMTEKEENDFPTRVMIVNVRVSDCIWFSFRNDLNPERASTA